MKVLVLTTDLPFFPGKNGHDYFNLRYLASSHAVAVVGPLHAFFPATGIANLESFLTAAYFWPRPAPPAVFTAVPVLEGRFAAWVEKLKAPRREKWLLRLLGLARQPRDAYLQLGIFANCAHHLLGALREHPWQAVVILQSNTEPWLRYLPGHLAKFVYFHDVRAHFSARQAEIEAGAASKTSAEQKAVVRQERRVCRAVELVGFVSALDEKRARELLKPRAKSGVAPIPVDTDYYTPPPSAWRKDGRRIVLFTGHLSHPPNVDAIVYFLRSIWPLVRQKAPDAVFQAAGLSPAPQVLEECAAAQGTVEVHPNVPDIRPFFWNSAAYVVPMRYGGGVRQKIFEAWLMRVPVVCTTMAAEGTEAEHGRNCWLENEPAAFAARVVEMLEGHGSAAMLSCAAETAATHNSIPIAAAQFQKLVRRTLKLKRKRPYKLLFDLRWMEIGKAGGLEQLAYEQLDAIGNLDRRNAYRVLCPRSTFSEWRFARGFQCKGFFTDANESHARALHAAVVNRLAQSLDRQPILTAPMRSLRFLHKLDFDLVHSVNSYINPDLSAFPQILTMCDLQHRHFPEFFGTQELREREQLYRDSAESARHIICISEHTRQDVHAQYGIPLAKMTAVWVIPSRAAWIKMEPARCRRLLAAMGVQPGRFLFFPAHPWPHKNHARLFSALAMIAKELPSDIRLVLTGAPFPPHHVGHRILEEGLQARVVHLGYRSPLEVRALYSTALALVFPSLFEGFGMPVAEAMIAGCPVACSNTSSLPEIAGNAAVTFDPANVEEMARAILRIVNEPALRSNLIAAGERRRPLFSARLQAVKTLAVYQGVFDQFYGD